VSRRIKRFIRSNSPLFSVMILLTIINALTTSYPWALFPIAAMAIPVFISAANIFFAEDDKDEKNDEDDDDDEEENEDKLSRAQGRDARRQARLERKLEKLERRYGPLPNTAETGTPAASLASTPINKMDDTVAAQLAEAKRYKDQMAQLLKGSQDKNKSDRLNELSTQMDEWMTSIQQMADRVSGFKRNTNLQHDKVTVDAAITKLSSQLANESDARIKQQLERTLNARQQQRDSLTKLDNVMRQAEIQLESTVAALGTIYSQALATQSTNQVTDYSHLSAEVNEQVHSLRDRLEALEEVKLGNNQISSQN